LFVLLHRKLFIQPFTDTLPQLIQKVSVHSLIFLEKLNSFGTEILSKGLLRLFIFFRVNQPEDVEYLDLDNVIRWMGEQETKQLFYVIFNQESYNPIFQRELDES